MTAGRTESATTALPRPAAVKRWPSAADFAVAGALALLWAGAVWRWQRVWSEVPDYAFGWAVPVLAVFLLWERWPDRPVAHDASRSARVGCWLGVGGALLALAPMRLMLEPFPTWPMMLWLLWLIVLGITLALVIAGYGRAMARHFAFPFAFVATALPWPAMANVHLIAPMREGLAAAAAQAVNFLGYPAIARGTVIEVGRGFVGVEEACSGVRSLQAAIMVALFLGELNRFTWRRRLALLAVGVGLALGTNLARTIFLAWESARQGPAAVAAWHDPAGYALLVVCLGGLVLAGWIWRGHAGKVRRLAGRAEAFAVRPRAVALAGVVAVVVLAIEAGTQAWYFQGDRAADDVPRLQATLPRGERSFQEDPFDAQMQTMLQCDTHELGHWTAETGAARAGYVLGWRNGQSARFTTAQHNPTVCLPMSGNELARERGVVNVTVAGVTLPFQAYVFQSERGPMHVYYLQWDVRGGETFARRAGGGGMRQWIAQQWREVRRGRRNFEALVFTLAIWGARDDADADQALARELPELVTVRRPAG